MVGVCLISCEVSRRQVTDCQIPTPEPDKLRIFLMQAQKETEKRNGKTTIARFLIQEYLNGIANTGGAELKENGKVQYGKCHEGRQHVKRGEMKM